MSNYGTPYDDSFRTLLTDCKRLIVPLVNEMFGENWQETENVELYQNEVFITTGADEKRITDSNFTIGNSRRYHIECQSSVDGTMTVRIFEYSTQIAITTAESDVSKTVFTMPASGILYLRCNDSTPDSHEIVVNTPGGTVSYKIPIVKIKDYSLDDMLSKKLFFLIPFYFFNLEIQNEYDVYIFSGGYDSWSANYWIEDMKNTYLKLWDQLESLVQQGKISEFEKSAIKAMCDKVAQSLTNKYDNVKEGVDSVMGGEILDYEAKRIRNESRNESNIEAVYNMLVANVDESVVQRMYPEQFEAGKKRFVSSKHVNV